MVARSIIRKRGFFVKSKSLIEGAGGFAECGKRGRTHNNPMDVTTKVMRPHPIRVTL
jgi:hypothetical protein